MNFGIFQDYLWMKLLTKYRTVLDENGMYLLHNDLFYKNESDDMGIIPYHELIQSDNQSISGKIEIHKIDNFRRAWIFWMQ